MKKIILLFCLVLPALTIHARAIQEDIRAAEEKAQISYAFGMLMGDNLSNMPLELDYTAFAEGMRAMLEDGIEPQLSEHEAVELVEGAIQIAMEKEAAENRQKEADFLSQNRQREGVMETESGLQYEIISVIEGEEERPQENSLVRVHYTGTFTNGSLFDSSEEEGSIIPLDMVIPGWAEGVMLMPKGSKYRFYIPSSLAYGSDGVHSIIPPYSTLIFDVELLEILNDTEFNNIFEQLQQQFNEQFEDYEEGEDESQEIES